MLKEMMPSDMYKNCFHEKVNLPNLTQGNGVCIFLYNDYMYSSFVFVSCAL